MFDSRNTAGFETLIVAKAAGRSLLMFLALNVLSVVVVAVAMALALAHALELPGKMRLPKEQYLAVQTIYYPGFTFGGAAEPIGMLMVAVLLFLIPRDTTAFWLTTTALVSLSAMHAAYWLLTHPVNKFWLKESELSGVGEGFFSFDPLRRTSGRSPEWTELRDRWEVSHVVRAALGLLSLLLLVTAVAA